MSDPASNEAPTRRELSLLKALTTRGGRKRSGCCRCEGVRATRELFANAPELVKFVAATGRGLAALGVVPPAGTLRHLSETELPEYAETVNSQGVIAVAAMPPAATGAVDGEFIVAFDQLGDPGNFGTVVRTFRAIGGREIWYTKGSIDPWCDKAVRSGLGAQFALRLRRFETLAELKTAAEEAGFPRFFLADPHDGEVCFDCVDLFDRSVLVIGGEANGVVSPPPGTRHVIIPMPGDYESLNAAQAATVLLLESVRRARIKNAIGK